VPDAAPLPEGFRVGLDRGVRRPAEGSVLIGGSPIRVMRLTPEGRRLVDRLTAGDPVPDAPGPQRLVRRLLDGGLAHPRPPTPAEPPRVAVVIPVRDDATGLAATLAALGGSCRTGRIVVVDDDSRDPDAITAAAVRPGAFLLRQVGWGGPAAARNAGWRMSDEPLIAFVDANCEPEHGWLDQLLPHFADPQVAAVAPRIVAASVPAAPPLLTAYETFRFPLDLGPREATVRPRSPVPYVPTTALIVRRSALEAVGGFDEALTVGEDVDLVWRLATAGWTIRYDPHTTVAHPTRSGWTAWLRQRYAYGLSAAPLASRHGRAVAPASMSAWSGAVWLLVAAGRPRLAAAVAVGSTLALTRTLKNVPRFGFEALRLGGVGHLRAGLTSADALRRAWPPAALLLAARRRSRPALAAALLVPPFLEWREHRPRLDAGRFAALRLADDLAYAAGVWVGCLRERSLRAVLPDLV
jgi:mycofactocin system glycosyltransferase